MPPAFRGGLVHELPDHVEARQPGLPPGGLKRAIGAAPAEPIALLIPVEQVERHPLEHQPPLPRRVVQGRLVMHLTPCTLTHAYPSPSSVSGLLARYTASLIARRSASSSQTPTV